MNPSDQSPDNRQPLDEGLPREASPETRPSGSSALRHTRRYGDSSAVSQHQPGDDDAPAAPTLGERLARDAAAARGGGARPAGDDPNPPTGFVGTAPSPNAPATQAFEHVGSAGISPAGSAHAAGQDEVTRGAAPASSGAGPAASPSRNSVVENADRPSGLAGVGAQGTRPEPDFLNGFDDDEVGEYVPGQWDEPAEETTTRAHRPVPAQPAGTPSAVRPVSSDTSAMPVSSSAGLAGAAAVAADEDRLTAERRKDEDTPFLRRADTSAEDTLASNRRSANDSEYRNRLAVLEYEKAAFGGIRLGSGFFGWITAMGMLGLLSLLTGAIFGVASYVNNTTSAQATRQIQSYTTGQALTGQNGIIAAVVAGLILAIAFAAGGYVAGRMARFSGVAQGLGVWLWFVAVTAALTVAGIFGISALPSGTVSKWVPSMDTLSSPAALISMAAVLVLSLLAAMAGGAAGMRYHRKIDRADFASELGEDWRDA
ncbi:hypothetical protein [Falsarthrobacter nasiphocae]|uniref:Integral membrane protein n=1 Tax=Falsarthrobacter nasiphocae TaxID=189863 RepID=A0AAE3YI62_9MICC|nr:hypothetical protein [Falsarthrobacter nasiphocae]MDR6892201.1 putative integral membrane protein [Falsarthrobacter nasiphocae]